MGAKKPDLISDRARTLSNEIAALEAEIKKLDTQLTRNPAPRFRSTALPGNAVARAAGKTAPAAAQKSEPVFEEIKHGPLTPGAGHETPEIYNDLGVRRYDLPALLSRIRNHFRAPTTSNPRLVNYLAVGSVQGLRPLRYEKRIARNRFLAVAAIVFIVLLGIWVLYWRNQH
jgi:hypothetical protein